MITPTPQQLSRSLTDFGRIYEPGMIGGTADAALSMHIKAMAKRVADRVRHDDPRLTAFTTFTDASGYVWIPGNMKDFWHKQQRGIGPSNDG